MIERFRAGLIKLRDSQGIPDGNRVEVDFDALCDVLMYGPDVALTPRDASPPSDEIIQADRDAAADLIETYWPGADATMMKLATSYRAGHSQGVFVRAFARHRLAASRLRQGEVGAPAPAAVGPPFHFRRYVGGVERAEGVTIERESTLEAAMHKAASICPKAPCTVLVLEEPALITAAQRPQAAGSPAVYTRNGLRDGLATVESSPAQPTEEGDAGASAPGDDRREEGANPSPRAIPTEERSAGSGEVIACLKEAEVLLSMLKPQMPLHMRRNTLDQFDAHTARATRALAATPAPQPVAVDVEMIAKSAVDTIMERFSWETLIGPENLRARLSMCARAAVEHALSLSTTVTAAPALERGRVEADYGTANSHFLDDQILVDGECIAFASEPWTDRIVAALRDPKPAERGE